MISASKMDAANVEAVLKRDVELVAANEVLSRLVDWDGPGAVENARELYEEVAAQVEEHASAERELRADLEARGACLQAEIVKLSQAQTSLDYAGVRRAELERELESAHSDVDNMKAQLYTLRGLQKTWQAKADELSDALGNGLDFSDAVSEVLVVIDALYQCRLFSRRIVGDMSRHPTLRDEASELLRIYIDLALDGVSERRRRDVEPGA